MPLATEQKPTALGKASTNTTRGSISLAKQKTLLDLPHEDIDYLFAALQFVEDVRRKSSGTSSGKDAAKEVKEEESEVAQESIDVVLEAFRMACTNLPIDKEAISTTREALDAALVTFAGDAALTQVAQIMALASKGREMTVDDKGREIRKADLPSFMQQPAYTRQQMQCVVPGLFVGSYHPARNAALLQQHNVTHILCCVQGTPSFPDTVKYLFLNADDVPQYNMAQHFEKSIAFIENAINKGGAVLVHCGAGISRAPTICAAYLIHRLRISHHQALRMVKAARSAASPNVGFTAQLKEFAESVRSEKR